LEFTSIEVIEVLGGMYQSPAPQLSVCMILIVSISISNLLQIGDCGVENTSILLTLPLKKSCIMTNQLCDVGHFSKTLKILKYSNLLRSVPSSDIAMARSEKIFTKL